MQGSLQFSCGREAIEEMEEGSTEIGRQRSEKRRMEQARGAPGRPPGRPVEEASRPARSTGVHGRAQEGGVAPVDRLKWLCFQVGAVDRAGRPWHGSVDRPVD